MKKSPIAVLAACLFLLIVGAKWHIFERYGSPMPDWDQWDAEAHHSLIPWLNDDHFLQHLLEPHNEHRIVLTKLQNLALTLWNGQWDSRVEAVANAILHAGFGVALWLVGRRLVGPRWQAPLFLLVVALIALPVAWQNVLGGFHAQQYWLLSLSFAAMVALPFARPWSASWWVGGLAAVLALGSMASGFVAAAVVLLVLGWRLWRREESARAAWPTLALCGVVVAIGIVTQVQVAAHESIKASTAHDFFFSIVHSLQWPWRHHHWAAAVLWLPWVVVACQEARRGAGRRPVTEGGSQTRPTRAVPQTILALGGWVLVQVAATAYARGVGAEYPASRYVDTLVLGTLANGLAVAWLLNKSGAPREDAQVRSAGMSLRAFAPSRESLIFGLLALAWVATFAIGMRQPLHDTLRIELPGAKGYYVKAEANMRRYIATNDPKHLDNPDIPYPSAQGIIDTLAHPGIRALMPVPLRPPLEMQPGPPSQAFLGNDARHADPRTPPRWGLTPATPPLDYAVSLGSFGPDGAGGGVMGEWRSAPLTSRLGGWLVFETAGFLGEPNEGVFLELRDPATDAVLARVRPARIPGEGWRAAYVRAPSGPFVVVARDLHPARWFAFSGPIEMGSLSYLASRATKLGALILWAGVAGTLLIAGWQLVARRGAHVAGETATPAGVET